MPIISANNNNHIRYNDPYSQRVFEFGDPPTDDSNVYLSRQTNLLTGMLGNDIVLDGLYVIESFTPSDIIATVSTGVAVVDSTLIRTTQSLEVTFSDANVLDDAGFFLVFLRYQYLETLESNPLQLKIVYLDSIQENIYPSYEGLEVNADRLLLAIIKMTKTAGFITSLTTYWYYTPDGYIEITDPGPPTTFRYYLRGCSESKVNINSLLRCSTRGYVVLQAPNGDLYTVTVDNSGVLQTTLFTHP